MRAGDSAQLFPAAVKPGDLDVFHRFANRAWHLTPREGIACEGQHVFGDGEKHLFGLSGSVYSMPRAAL